MRFTVEITGLERTRDVFARLKTTPDRAIARLAVQIEDYVSGEVGKHAKAGFLERSLGKKRIPGGWEISHDDLVAPYARFVHDGTKPHVIYPSGRTLDTQRELYGKRGSQRKLTAAGKLKAMPGGRKLVLRWASGGKFHFAQHVNHPGNKPDRWMDRAAALAPNLFRAQIEQFLKDI